MTKNGPKRENQRVKRSIRFGPLSTSNLCLNHGVPQIRIRLRAFGGALACVLGFGACAAKTSWRLAVPPREDWTPEREACQWTQRLTGSSATFPILSRDPNLSRKPPETQGSGARFLKGTMVEKNGESTLEWCLPPVQGAKERIPKHLGANQRNMTNAETPFELLGIYLLLLNP